MTAKKNLPYRPNVCLLITNRKGRFFMGKRLGTKIWQLPQGGVGSRELEERAAIREAAEELGTSKRFFKVITKLPVTHRYKFKSVPRYAKGRWCGQKQSFWLLKFIGKKSDIKLDRFEQEFSAFKWVELDKIVKTTEPKRRKGYKKALAALKIWQKRN
jgi:putative (di)nucleoside polyphosphate hydrolase